MLPGEVLQDLKAAGEGRDSKGVESRRGGDEGALEVETGVRIRIWDLLLLELQVGRPAVDIQMCPPSFSDS